MQKQYYEVKYFVGGKEQRYGTDTFWATNPEKWIREMSKAYPHVDFYEYRKLPKPRAND